MQLFKFLLFLYNFYHFFFRRMKWKKENKSKLDGPDGLDESPDSN